MAGGFTDGNANPAVASSIFEVHSDTTAAPTVNYGTVLPADIPGLTCAATTSPTSRTAGDAGGGGSCTVRDVWAQQDRPCVQTSLRMQLREHESGFFVLGPAADETVPTTE